MAEQNTLFAIGICLGASTVTAVKLQKTDSYQGEKYSVAQVIIQSHEGNPRESFTRIIKLLAPANIPVVITGRKFSQFVRAPSLIEAEAIEYALEYIRHKAPQGQKREPKRVYDALVSLGGETFVVYVLNHEQKITGISTGNKCASGTGEFFLQQIRRMNLEVDQAVALALQGEAYPVSGRCSVFCKSDCTHALNKGESIMNVTAGLCRMIAGKILEILAKVPHSRIILTGGTTQNRAVVRYLREHIESLTIPEEAPYFEALGAALAAFDRGKPLLPELFHEQARSFNYLPPLSSARHFVTFHTLEYRLPEAGDRCIVGLDVGSTTTKAVVMRLADHSLLAAVYLRTNGNPVEASRACFKTLIDRLKGTPVTIIGLGVTGSGRQIAGLYALTDGIINEIIAHATAAAHFDPGVDTIFEIGGQDAKYTHLTAGVASDYAMNEACSAGTGSFLEESAYESLNVKMEEIAGLALKGTRPPNFSDQCAAFISSDIKNATHEGLSREDILAGLVYSICFNYVNRVKGNRPVGKKVFMQGGVCYNRAVPLAMAAILQRSIVVPPEPGLMGAFGVALETEKRIQLGLLPEKYFDLEQISERLVSYRNPFTCTGGKEKCDRKCTINRIEIEGKVYPFGGSCSKYYNHPSHKQNASEDWDLVAVRHQLLFRDYVPVLTSRSGGPVIGLNRSFMTFQLFPLYNAFFSRLGCRLVLPDQVETEATNRQVTSMCFPTEVSIGYFENLMQKNPDYVFMPYVKELYVPRGIRRLDFCAVCAFSAGEAFWLKQAYRDKPDWQAKVLSPYLNFNGGWEKGEQALVATAQSLGFSETEARQAYQAAVRVQYQFEQDCQAVGKKTLARLELEPDRVGIVLFGRPYNAYAPQANKGIPKKFSSKRYLIIPYDMLPYIDEPLGEDYKDYMHWEAGQKILRCARLVKRHPQLYGLFITNFLCAPDSFLVSFFRKEMGNKPSLTLELDAHTADAGINTRVEAFLDIIHNYRAVQTKLPVHNLSDFTPARVRIEQLGTYFISSSGRKLKLTDPKVKLILPPMGKFGSQALAATCRKLGISAVALPKADAEVLRLGRSAASGKECLPMLIILGALLKYLKYREQTTEKLILLIPKAAGYCRLGQYHVYINQYIKENRLNDVCLLSLGMEEQFAGLGPVIAYHAWQAIVTTDVLDDIENAILALAKNPETGMRVFQEEAASLLLSLEGKSSTAFWTQLKRTAGRLAAIPLKQAYEQTAQIALTGEFFVRKDAFSNLNLASRLASKGFIVRTSSIAEWLLYVNYLIKQKQIKPDFTFLTQLEFLVQDHTQKVLEKRIKTIMQASGLYKLELINIPRLIRYAKPLLAKDFPGEPGLIAGLTMAQGLSEYCGIVNVGPFGCIQTRMGDAVTAPQTDVKGIKEALQNAGENFSPANFSDDERLPFLFVESDGNPYPQLLEARFESFCLQSARIAEKQGKRRAE